MKKVLISACLAGVKCRYDEKGNFVEKVQKMVEEGKAVLVCPEQLGGLSTPRTPAEIVNGKVIDKNGLDITINFVNGANEAHKIGEINNCDSAILKAKSPSCGCGKIYDGTFSKTLKNGDGVFCKLLKEKGYDVKTEEDL